MIRLFITPGRTRVQDQILAALFSDHSVSIRLVSMSRFVPADHQDCIIANEFVTQVIPSNSTSSSSESESSHSTVFQLSPLSARSNSCISVQLKRYFSCISLLVLLCLFCLISTSLINVLTNSSSNQQFKYVTSKENNAIDESVNNQSPKLQSIQLEEIFQNELAADYFNGSWVSDNEIAYYDNEYNLCLYDSNVRKVQHLIGFPIVLSKGLKGLQLSKDLNFLIWPTETIELFRHSKLEKLKILNIANNTVINLFPDSNFSDAFFQFAVWGPMGSQLVFAFNNDLYYKHSPYSETIRLTVTGVRDVIFNGHTDWLYEEEILNTNTALWFSPNGTDLAYLQINDTLVDVMSWNRYGEYYNISNNQYPVRESIRYPKPGTHNPEVSLYVINLHTDVNSIQIKHIQPPSSMASQDLYITKVTWFDNNNLLVAWTIRNQTQSTLVICDRYSDWNCNEIHRQSSRRGWIDGFEHGLLGSPLRNVVLVRIPQLINRDKGEYYHVASIDLQSKHVNYLTTGQYDVVKLLAYNPMLDEIFYASTMENHPEVQHIMKTSLKEKQEPICLTCYLGNSCRYNEAHFNPSASRLVLECNGYEIPRVELRDAQNNALIETLEHNHKLFRFLTHKFIPRYEKLMVKLTDGTNAIVELILPHNFDEEMRYPVVVELYGAPGTQSVRDKYEMNHWSSYLSSEKEYIYCRVDARGSANQGVRHMHQLYKNVGHLEVDDFIDVIWFMRNNVTYIDTNRIALWGWSYGGYYALMSLIREFDNRLFSCAIAVAPVSNWMYYDSAYSERYLGVPDSKNLYSYEDSNLLDNVLLLKNKKFMVVFGTSDDNVHIQHSLLLIRKLNDLNIDYDIQIYPDDNHYLLKSSPHLYRKMSNYIEQCFTQPPRKS